MAFQPQVNEFKVKKITLLRYTVPKATEHAASASHQCSRPGLDAAETLKCLICLVKLRGYVHGYTANGWRVDSLALHCLVEAKKRWNG